MFETAGSTSLTIVGKILVGWCNSMFLKQKGSERGKRQILAQQSKVSFVSEIVSLDTRKWSNDKLRGVNNESEGTLERSFHAAESGARFDENSVPLDKGGTSGGFGGRNRQPTSVGVDPETHLGAARPPSLRATPPKEGIFKREWRRSLPCGWNIAFPWSWQDQGVGPLGDGLGYLCLFAGVHVVGVLNHDRLHAAGSARLALDGGLK